MTFKEEFDKYIKDVMCIGNSDHGEELLNEVQDVLYFLKGYNEKNYAFAFNDIRILESAIMCVSGFTDEYNGDNQ